MFVQSAAEGVLTLAALRVVSAQAKKARLTLVAARPLDVALATALSSHHAEGRVRVAVAHPSVLRTVWVAVTGCGTYRSLITQVMHSQQPQLSGLPRTREVSTLFSLLVCLLVTRI